MVSCREASVFFKKRAVLEEEYGRGMHKLAKVTAEVGGGVMKGRKVHDARSPFMYPRALQIT